MGNKQIEIWQVMRNQKIKKQKENSFDKLLAKAKWIYLKKLELLIGLPAYEIPKPAPLIPAAASPRTQPVFLSYLRCIQHVKFTSGWVQDSRTFSSDIKHDHLKSDLRVFCLSQWIYGMGTDGWCRNINWIWQKSVLG